MKKVAIVFLGVLMLAATAQASFIVENRAGGQNYANFSAPSGWATSTGNVNAPGCTANIGSMYSGTGTYFGPSRYAQFSFTPDVSGDYQIDLAWTSTAGQTDTAVNVYTGAATGGTTPDAWGNTGGPIGILFTRTMDMYYKNVGIWNQVTTMHMDAGTTYKVGIYGGHVTTTVAGTPNRVASGAAQFTLVPEPAAALLLSLGSLVLVRRRRTA
jgi:hypothetical protein